MNKTVSIITPSYNRADIVHETARSIFNQTYSEWEWVIVDDGSTDESWQVLQGFAQKDKRIKIFKRETNPKGACNCRNIAVENCTGEYLIFLDTDDLLASFCLEQRVKAMEENPECDFIIFPMFLFKNQPDDLKLLWNIENGQDDLHRILIGDPICQGTGTMWKKSSFKKIGMWNVDLKLWQDIELHIRSILNNLTFCKRMDLQPDIFLRISDTSLSRTGFHSLPKLRSRMQVFSYAAENIIKQNLLSNYKEGLRVMGYDIIFSAIRSSQFHQAESMIKTCSENDIFTSSEIKNLNKLKSFYKFKLYKIPLAAKLWQNKLQKTIPKPQISITKIKWEMPIQL